MRSVTMTLCACVLMTAAVPGTRASESSANPSALSIAELPSDIRASASDVVAGKLDGAFNARPDGSLTTSTTSHHWFRVSLQTDWADDDMPVLSIVDAAFARVYVYAPPDYREQPLWHERPDAAARFSRHALSIVLPSNLRSDRAIYLRTDVTPTPKRMHVTVTRMSAYQAGDLDHVRLMTLFASVQFVMIMVGICLWVTLRDRVFAYFVAYAGLQLGYQMLASGEAYDLPGGTALAAFGGQRAAWFLAMTSATFSISFILEFCSLKRNSPGPAAILGAMRWPFAAVAALLAIPWFPLTSLLQNIANLMFLVSSLLAMAVVANAAFHGNRASTFFLVAWMPQVAFTGFRVTQLLLALPQPAWIEYGFPLTMAFSSIVIVIGLADSMLRARRERDIAHGLAERDGLTGVLNRRALNSRLSELIAQVRAGDGRLALLFIDIDHFKAINDKHGHLAGDTCLKAVASAVVSSLAGHQYFGRYGGEEFLAILPGASRQEAASIGEQLRKLIEELVIDAECGDVKLTASIGVACLDADNESIEQFVERADKALYRAKAEGRNRVGTQPLVAASS